MTESMCFTQRLFILSPNAGMLLLTSMTKGDQVDSEEKGSEVDIEGGLLVLWLIPE